jgi:tetratricopeptide (TPR) repeat protein
MAGLTSVSLGQSPDQQAALAALSDSLRSAATVEDLAQISRTWAYKVPGVMKELRKGLHLLRQGEIEHDQDLFDRALAQFEWATGSATDWPYPRYGMALSLFGMKRYGFENREVTSKAMADYTAFYQGGEQELRHSWQNDSTFQPTTDFLIDLMDAEGERVQQPWRIEALEARRIMAGAPDPRVELLLGRAYRRSGDLSEALLSFEFYQVLGGNPAVGALERARTLSGMGEEGAAIAAYQAGLWQVDSVGRAFYRADLAWITTFDELLTFDAIEVDSIASWVKKFWALLDAEELQAPGERLREHLRRWHVAHQLFRVTRPWQRAFLNPPLIQEVGACTQRSPLTIDELEFSNPSRPDDLRGMEPFLDHRAVIYIRHGAPIHAVWQAVNPIDIDLLETYPMVIKGTIQQDVEGWVYLIDGDYRTFHFTNSQALGFGTSINTVFLPADYFRTLARVVGQYNTAAAAVDQAMWLGVNDVSSAVPYRCQRRINKIAERIQQDMETGVQTQSYTLLFPEAFEPTVQAFGLPGVEGDEKGTVLVVFAVPLERLTVDSLPSGTPTVSLRFRLSAIDSASKAVVWIDSTRTFLLEGPVDPAAKLTGFMEMPAPEGSFGIRVAIQSPDSLVGSAVVLPTPVSVWGRSDSLRVSSLVTGRPDANLAWAYGGQTVVLNPLNTYYPNGTATLFYVVDGQVPGNSYRTTITLQQWDDDEDILSLSFEETAATLREYRRRDLVLTDLDAERYRIRLTLLDVASNRTVIQEQVINLLDRAR